MLKRGARFLCLEFSQVDLPVLDRLYAAYCEPRRSPRIGKVVAGDGAALPLSGRVRYAASLRRRFSPA